MLLKGRAKTHAAASHAAAAAAAAAHKRPSIQQLPGAYHLSLPQHAAVMMLVYCSHLLPLCLLLLAPLLLLSTLALQQQQQQQ
jgi:hypothetical protein